MMEIKPIYPQILTSFTPHSLAEGKLRLFNFYNMSTQVPTDLRGSVVSKQVCRRHILELKASVCRHY